MVEVKLIYEQPHATPSVQVQMLHGTGKAENLEYLSEVIKTVRQVILTDRILDIKLSPGVSAPD